MKKKILSVILAAIMTMTIATVSFSAFATENVAYKVITTVNADNTLTVDVILPGSAKSTGGSVLIGYNKDKLTYQSGKVLVTGTINPNYVDGADQGVFFNAVAVEAFTEDTKMATITFTINGVVEKSDIKILKYEALNENLDSVGSEKNGTITPEVVCLHPTKNWTVKQAATETAEGIEESICPVCGVVETRTIPKLAPAPTVPTTVKKPVNNPKTGAEGVTAKAIVALFSVATLAGVTVAGKKLTKKEK